MTRSKGSGFRALACALMLLLTAVAGFRAEGQAASGYSEYYVPGPEGSNTGSAIQLGMWWVFDDLDDANAANDTTMHSVITVTAWSQNSTIYYDHWENGLGFDPNNPSTADETYTLTAAGAQRVFESSNIPTTPRGTATYYDGGDRIFVAGGTVTVSRAIWIEGVGAGNQAVAWEIYPVKPQLTTYVIPFGENLTFTPFTRVYALIQATANNTTFTVDLNGDGTPDALNQNHDGDKTDGGDIATVSLQAGQTFLLDRVSACPNGATVCASNPGTLNSGVVIQGSSTLQVKFVAGDPGQRYCARGLSAFPRGYWTKDYYAPLDQPTGASYDTDYYLHNPHAAPLTVTWESRTANGSFSIPANSTISYRATAGAVSVDSGLYFKANDVFWGVGISDSGDVANGATFEWGYSLLPSTFLYTEHYLGWAPGYASWAGGDATNWDDVGVFLTVAQDNTSVFVDLDNDGTADQTYTLDRLQTQFIYDPNDGDLSQAHIWATGDFTMAYGENRDTAETSNPSLDLGYVAIPGTDFLSLVMGVNKSVSPQVVPTASGSRATFTIEVSTKEYAVEGVAVVDQLPPSWAYVSGTTVITLPDQTDISGASADPVGMPLPTYADQFGTISYSNNDSTPVGTNWTTAWIEAGENDGTGNGNVRVAADGALAVNALQFRNSAANGRALARIADLSSFPGGTLQFTYRRVNNNAADSLAVQVCADAVVGVAPAGITCTTGWVSAPSIAGGATDAAYQNYSVDLRALLPTSLSTPAFAIRFTTYNSTLAGTERFWIDDVRIVPVSAGGSFIWPPSTLGDMAPNQLLRITFQAETTAVLPLGTLSQNRTVASATRTVGSPTVTQSFSATDFAYVATGDLQITKGSSAPSPLYPGDQFTYTVTVNNPSGGAIQNRLALYDALPAGVTSVPGTTTLSRSSVADAFGTAAFTNNQGSRNWSSNWVDVDSGGAGAAAGLIQVIGGVLRLNNAGAVATQSVTRGINLTASGATQATLVFNYTTSGNLNAADVMTVQYRLGGAGLFNTLGTFTDDGTGLATFPIPLATPANLTEVRFAILAAGAFAGAADYFYVDNLSITYNQSFVTGNPPDLLPAAYLYALAGGQSLTAIFNVTVDDPFPAGSTLLTNTASTTSAQLPIQLTASVTDQVTVPTALSATVAGRVWLDTSNFGVQDIGEPGLSNVQVTLKDQFGTPVATLTSDANGRYFFPGVTPGNGYYVEVASGLPGGVVQSYPVGRTDDRTASFNLAEGQNYTGADLGYRPPAGTATFGDLVWVDANNNQARDPGEVGLGGTRIRLFRDQNGDGFLDPLVDTLVGEPGVGPGTVSATNGSTTVTGVGTRFTTLGAGDPITIAGVRYTIASVTNNTTLLLTAGHAGTATTVGYTAGTAEGVGTVGVTSGSATVTGTGTSFTSLAQGDPIVIRGVRYRVLSVTSDTQLTLTTNVTGATASGLAYGVANTTVSAADGSYLFTGAPASGSETYFVSATSPSGYVSTTGSVSRFQNVGSGNIFLTADFGFRSSGTTYSISDRVWMDADNDMYFDGGAAEPGIGSVTVDLLDASLNVVGTTTTAADGTFTFSGLAGGGADYTVRLSDASGILANYSGTTVYATARQRAEPNLTANVDRRTAAAWPNGPSYGFLTTRSIGDSVYYDVNGNGSQDVGENGFAGVPVSLYRDVNGSGTVSLTASPGGSVAATSGSATVTGTGTSFLQYHAGEPILINGIAYTIASVASNTSLTLTTNATATYPSGTAWSGPTAGPGTVSTTNGSPTVTGNASTVFTTYRAGEPITINGVVYTILSITSNQTLTLTTNATATNANVAYHGPGDAFLGSVTTNASGQYLFAGLPVRTYVVSVPVPVNYNYIPGTRTDTDGTFPGVQLAATVSGTANVFDRDFGFQAPSAGGVQGTIWNDTDNDGAIDGTETGRFAGVTVEVLSGSTVVATLTTNASGFYSVGGLAVGTYTVRVTDTAGVLTGNTATTVTSRSVAVTANTSTTSDFGFRPPTPTYVSVSYLKASLSGGTIVVEWQTTQEVGTVGFQLLRLDPKTGDYPQVSEALLPALFGHPEGGTYTFQDESAPRALPLAYKLVEVDAWGSRHEYGPWVIKSFGEGVPIVDRYRRTANTISGADQARLATLQRERGAAAAVADRAGQKASWLKFNTMKAGLHFIDAAALAGILGEKANSLASRIASGRVLLENLGTAIPYSPAAGGAGLYFYAEAMESPYTNENVYWVAAQKGVMMTSWSAPSTGATPVASFLETVHAEVDRLPLPAYFRDPEADFYCWEDLFAGYPGYDTRTVTTSLLGVAGTGEPALTVRLHGGSNTEAPADHHVRITWNDKVVGDTTWDGAAPHEITLPLLPSDLVEGQNELVLTALLDSGVAYSSVYLDSFDVTYQRLYRAIDQELSFTVPAGADAAVTGFASTAVVLLDITTPASPLFVTGATAFAAGDGTYGLRFANRGGTPRSYLAVLAASATRPATMTPVQDAGLSLATNGADYLLVAPSSLVAAAESLAAYRRTQGFDTKVVDLEDIHDEFGYGLATPVAVQDFLSNATETWWRAPQYVTLVGRGTWDYKDAQGVGDNVMPTLLVGTPYGLAASDVSFTALTTGTGRGVKAIGRLPVLTSQELLDYVAKVQAHEAAPVAAWQQNLLLTADNPDAGGAFTTDSDGVGALAPATFLKTKVYLTTYSAPDARTAIRDTLNSGALLFNYIGHGGPDRLADESIFNKTDVPFLTNAGRLPVFLAMTCSSGNFAIPGFPSLSEALVLWASGGAYVSWAPSGLSLNDGAVALNEAFFHGAFVEGEKVVGRNCTKAIEGLDGAGPAGYMKSIYNIIGEPVVRLP